MADDAKMLEFKRLVERHAPENGARETSVKDFFVYRSTKPQQKREIYDSGIAIMASGRKRCFLNGRTYDYSVGSYLGVFLPMPVEVEELDASPEAPVLGVGLRIDLSRVAELLLKLDRLASTAPAPPAGSAGIFTAPLGSDLLDPVIRLLRALDDPADVAVLSGSIVEEIHYRLLRDRHVGAIRRLLEQRGQIQQIARAVEHINANLAAPVVVEDLAERAHMSVSHFHKSFKDVMQMPPLQYAKRMKLLKAQALIQAGQKASQAAFAVGYSSAAQFSREYKRQFGFSPSATA